jgi:hypothetical protein
LDAQVLDFIEGLSLPTAFINWGVENFGAMSGFRDQTGEVERRSLSDVVAAKRRAIDNLIDLRLRDLLTDDEYRVRRQTLEREELTLKERQSRVVAEGAWIEPCERLLSFVNRAAEWFLRGNANTKRLILQVTGSNPTMRDKIFNAEAKKPFRRLGPTTSVVELCTIVKDVSRLLK